MSHQAYLTWIALILATLYICYFHNLGAIGFVGPDEPRYAWIARAMVESGDWITPRLYGKPWFEKPPLYYWGAAASFKLFGVSEAAARLPSAVSALLATLALAWLALRLYGAETSRWLLLLLPTTVGMIGFSHAAATDMPFAGMLTVAMVWAAFIIGLVRDGNTPILPRTPWLALLLFGFFLGLAALAKGPAAIILAGGAVLLWAIATKRWRDALRCLHPIAVVAFCATALPWYILCARRNPDFFGVFIIEHNFKRYLTPEFQHIQPFWFYTPIVLLALLPWTLLLVWSAKLAFLRRFQFSATTILLLSWAAFCLIFFSASKSKLPGYILPSVPPLALLLTRASVVSDIPHSSSFRWIRFGFSFLGLPVAVALLWLRHYNPSITAANRMLSAAFALFLLGLANLLLANKVNGNRFRQRTAPLCVLPVLSIVITFRPLASPWLMPSPSAKSLALQVEWLEKSLPASEFFVLPADRNLKFGLSFYLHRDVQFWDPEKPSEGYLLVKPEKNIYDCNRYLQQGWHCSMKPIQFSGTGWVAYRIHRSKSVLGLQ
jgi:4-amino-4-deoxy-L-arabinose transferase-like glycosyltransferase